MTADRSSPAPRASLVSQAIRILLLLAASSAAAWIILRFAYPDEITTERVIRAAALAFLAALFLTGRMGRAALRRLFTQPGQPLDLAIWRIVLFGAILILLDPPRLVWLSTLPAELSWDLTGIGAAFSAIPRPTMVVLIGSWVMAAACVSAIVGYRARTAALIVTLLGLYLFTGLEIHGKTRWIHHLVWMAAMMAAAPCGDALSIDELLARRKRRRLGAGGAGPAPITPSLAHALPVRFAWLFMAVVYFFPGFWKFVISGWAWFAPENLANKMLERWYLKDFIPPVRVDEIPALATVGAVGSVLFELLFVFAILFPLSRRLMFPAMFVFHYSTNVFMGIDFAQMLLISPVLVDWSALAVRLGGETDGPTDNTASAASADSPGRSSRMPVFAVNLGIAILVLAVLHGALHVRSWPFAVYPGFQGLTDDVYREDVLRADFGSGPEVVEYLPILKRRLRHSQARALVKKAVRFGTMEERLAQSEALWSVLVREEPDLARARNVQVVSRRVRLDPDNWEVVPDTTRVVFEFEPRP